MKTIRYLNFLLAIILLHASFNDALVLEFGEADFSLREDRGPLRALVVARGGLSGSITVQVTPITVSQFVKEGLSPLPDDLGNLDHAEQGDDFDNSSIILTLQGELQSVEDTAIINIVDDSVSEYEEVFLLVLRVVNATEGNQIDMGRNVSVVRIRQDGDAFMTRVSFSTGSLSVGEGEGLLNDTLFIEMEGVAEPTLYFQISTSEGIIDDIRPLLSNISIPSGVRRVAVPLEVIDDEIVEDPHERVRIRMSSSLGEQLSLFQAGAYPAVAVTIVDNDRPHFGFEVDLPSTTSPGNSITSRQLLEGRSAEVCVLLLEPNEFVTDVQISVHLSSASGSKPVSSLLKIDGLEEDGYFFSRGLLRHCFNITAIEDDIISESSTVNISLTPQAVFLYPNEVERVDTDILQVVIRDNDGIPKAPSDIKLKLTNGGKDLLITWRAQPTPLQPISQYLVIVNSTDASRSRRSVIGRSARQTDDIETKTTEHRTMDTRLTLKNIESGIYAVQVCAENDLGHTCTPPRKFTIKSDGKLLILQPVSSDGLGPSDNAESTSLPLGYIIAIIVVPSLLVLAVCFLVILVLLCSCCRHNSKSYFPSQQEKKMKQQNGDLDEEYVKSPSMTSISSTTSSVSEFTPV